MARVTIEDCTKIIPSRFELVVLAAQRAKEICAGARLTVDRQNDKNAVVALREIAAGNIDPESLKDSLIKKFMHSQPSADKDVPDDEFSSQTSSEAMREMQSFEGSEEDDDAFDDGYSDMEEDLKD